MLRALFRDGRRVVLAGISAVAAPMLLCDTDDAVPRNVVCSRSFGTTSLIGQHVPVSTKSRHSSRDGERCIVTSAAGLVLGELTKEQMQTALHVSDSAPKEMPSNSLVATAIGDSSDARDLLGPIGSSKYWYCCRKGKGAWSGLSGGYILAPSDHQPMMFQEYAFLMHQNSLHGVQLKVSVQLDQEGKRWKVVSTSNPKPEDLHPPASEQERELNAGWLRGQVSVAEPVFGVKFEWSTSTSSSFQVHHAKLYGVPITMKMAVDAVSPSWAEACGSPELASLLRSGSPDDMVKARIMVGTPTELTPTTWRQAGHLAHKAWDLPAVLFAVTEGKLDAASLKGAFQHGYKPSDVSSMFETLMKAGTPANGAVLKALYDAGLLDPAQIDRLRIAAFVYVSHSLTPCP